jgi:polyribonucleotide nucleotidyltransferase
MLPENHQYSTEVAGKALIFESGRIAGQAGGAVTLRLGDSMIFASATMSSDPREGIDFFPLSVDYEERMYAGGRIPGSFFRREGRPTEEAILTARLTDRPLRPLFPKDMRNDVQVILYSFSADGVHPLDILCINAASAALMISDIPWGGPIAAVRVGRVDGELVVNPTYEELGNSDLDLRLAGTRDAILMVECGAYEVPEDVMVQAMALGHESLRPILDLQEKMRDELGKPKRSYTPFAVADELKQQVSSNIAAELEQILETHTSSKHDLDEAVKVLQDRVVEEMVTEDGPSKQDVVEACSPRWARYIRYPPHLVRCQLQPTGAWLWLVYPR